MVVAIVKVMCKSIIKHLFMHVFPKTERPLMRLHDEAERWFFHFFAPIPFILTFI